MESRGCDRMNKHLHARNGTVMRPRSGENYIFEAGGTMPRCSTRGAPSIHLRRNEVVFYHLMRRHFPNRFTLTSSNHNAFDPANDAVMHADEIRLLHGVAVEPMPSNRSVPQRRNLRRNRCGSITMGGRHGL